MKPLHQRIMFLMLACGTTFSVWARPPSGIIADATGSVYYIEETGTPNQPIWRVDAKGGKTLLLSGADAGRLSDPHQLCADKTGNLYVASGENGVVWRITPSGEMSQYYPAKSERGLGIVGTWGDPFAVDDEGDIYCINRQQQACQILKLTRDGVIRYVVGAEPGSVDGVGAQARFKDVHYGGMACGPDHSLFVVDGFRIRKISADGATVTTLAGGEASGLAEGQGTTARFGSLGALAADGRGNLYAADSVNRRIRKITSEGMVSTFGIVPLEPAGVAVRPGPGGGVVVLERGGEPWVQIHEISAEGKVTLIMK